jgi:glyoxylase-like metal-dependent hydrolase (beta-lactamase superfamily II)
MYRLHELGDCFLLTFAAGGQACRLLIDCGSFRNSKKSIDRLKEITTDVEKTLNGAPLDVVVGTHQHNDHLSGFVHCEPAFRTKIAVERVWLSWLDDPQDTAAQGIGEKFNNIVHALFAARNKLQRVSPARLGTRALERVDDILGFYGARGAKTPPELPANAVKVLRDIGKQPPKFLRPGNVFDLPGLPPDSVRVHVLGPPRETKLLYDKDPKSSETYDKELARAGVAAVRFLDAVSAQKGSAPREEQHFPFSESRKRRGAAGRSPALKKLVAEYGRRDAAWRRVDDDWLQQAEGLALYLDEFTNNSSLVLAFELVKSGKVLLFAADAQTGNWNSWSTVTWEKPGVKTDDLLARTVLYKVGHHGSHNATLVGAFEKMTHPDLVALIPVHKQDPNITKTGGWKMPAHNLFKVLKKRTKNRVLQMDGVNPASCNPAKNPAKASWAKLKITPKTTKMYVELTVKGGG